LNDESITVNIAEGGTSTGTLTDENVSTEVVTELQAITNTWTTFASLFATGFPAADNATLLSLLADKATFLEDGEDLDSWLIQTTTDSFMIGLRITNVTLISMDEAAGTAQVILDAMQNGVAVDGPPGICNMIKQNGTWRYAGNGRIAHVSVRATAEYFPYNSSNKIITGLDLYVEANHPAGASVKSAVVTGPGLPAGGVILNKQIEHDWFAISGGEYGNLYIMKDDATIGAIPDNAEYTIKLYDATDGQGTLKATYTETILKRPLKNSELTSASFPTVTTPTPATLPAFTGGNLTVTWTMPTGLSPDWVWVQLSGENGNNTVSAEADITGTELSKTLTVSTPSFTVVGRNLCLSAKDGYGRKFYYILNIWII